MIREPGDRPWGRASGQVAHPTRMEVTMAAITVVPDVVAAPIPAWAFAALARRRRPGASWLVTLRGRSACPAPSARPAPSSTSCSTTGVTCSASPATEPRRAQSRARRIDGVDPSRLRARVRRGRRPAHRSARRPRRRGLPHDRRRAPRRRGHRHRGGGGRAEADHAMAGGGPTTGAGGVGVARTTRRASASSSPTR